MNHHAAFTRFCAVLAICILVSALCMRAAAQPTAFTYQGRLETTNGPANGLYDFTFTLYSTNTGGAALTAAVSNGVPVSDGLFTVQVDFLSAAWFNDDERWLELTVRTNGGGESPVVLSPRQKINSTPYALRSFRAETASAAAWGGLTGTPAGFADGVDNDTTYLAGTGLNLIGSNILTLNTNFTHSLYWRLTGNGGTTAGVNFLGTTDDEPLELKVNGERALRLEPDAGSGPNVIEGAAANTVTGGASGATVGGGQANRIGSYTNAMVAVPTLHSTIGGGLSNAVTGGVVGTIGGGRDNRLEGTGGRQVHHATIGGGRGNAVLSDIFESHYSSIGGGLSNRVSTAGRATIGGGEANRMLLEGHFATIGGGQGNTVDGPHGTISGGFSNSVVGPGNPDYASIGGGRQNAVIADSHYATIAGGRDNHVEGFANHSSIGGGMTNSIVFADFATIGGGATNSVTGNYGVVPGGRRNRAEGSDSFAAGRRAVAEHNGSFVWADDTDADFSSTATRQFAVRANNGVMIQGATTALDLRGGGRVRVAGAGVGTSTPVFVHQATAGNVAGNSTVLNHPHCNNDPDAILFVTQNWNPGGVGNTYNNHPIGVWYNGLTGRWAIFNQDLAAMPVDAAFNVMIVKP